MDLSKCKTVDELKAGLRKTMYEAIASGTPDGIYASHVLCAISGMLGENGFVDFKYELLEEEE